MSRQQSPLIHQKSLPHLRTSLLSNYGELYEHKESQDTSSVQDKRQGGRTMTLVKNYSMIEKRDEKKTLQLENTSAFQKLPLKPSFVAQIKSETQKVVSSLTRELEYEKSLSKEYREKAEALKKQNEELINALEKMKADFESLSHKYSSVCLELNREKRESKDSTDDTISSCEAGRYAEASYDVLPVDKSGEQYSDSIFQNSTSYSSGSSESVLTREPDGSRKRTKRSSPALLEDIRVKTDDKKETANDASIKKSKTFTDAPRNSSDESSEGEPKPKKREKKPSSLKIKRKKKPSDKLSSDESKNQSFKIPLTEKKKRKEKIQDEEGVRARSRSIDHSKDLKPLPEKSIEDSSPSLSESEKSIEDQWVLDYEKFFFIDELGKGNASTVYYGTYNSKPVAIKVLRSENHKREIEDFKKEMHIMSSIRDPHIVHFYGASLAPKLCIVLENCTNGTLFHYMQNESKSMDWSRSLQWMLEMVEGVNALHSWTIQIVHRDLKTLNILLDADLKVKVCDFGLSRFVSGDHDQKTFFKMRGTYAYIPPEVYKGKPFTSKSDVYSIGIILWEIIHRIIVGRHMRPYAEYPNIIRDFQIIIQAATKNLRPTLPSNTPEELKTIYFKCVDNDPDNRPSCEQLIEQIKAVQTVYQENKEQWDEIAFDVAKQARISRLTRNDSSRSPKRLARKEYTRDFKKDLQKLGIDPKNKNLDYSEKRVSTTFLKDPTTQELFGNRYRSISHSSIERKTPTEKGVPGEDKGFTLPKKL